MTETSHSKEGAKDRQRDLVIKMVRLSGVLVLLFGAGLFFDVAGLAAALGLAQDGLNRIVGAALLIMGMADIVLIPRILEGVLTRR